MTALAPLQFWYATDLVKSYTKEWKEYLLQEDPELEWKYWLKSQPDGDCPFFFRSYFCDIHKGYWKHSKKWNFRSCNICGKLPLDCWPLFIFECDECENQFIIKRYPIHYQLCGDCGG